MKAASPTTSRQSSPPEPARHEPASSNLAGLSDPSGQGALLWNRKSNAAALSDQSVQQMIPGIDCGQDMLHGDLWTQEEGVVAYPRDYRQQASHWQEPLMLPVNTERSRPCALASNA